MNPRAASWPIALAFVACRPTGAAVDVQEPASVAPPPSFVEPAPEPTAAATPALAQLSLEPLPGEDNLLYADAKGSLDHACSLRMDARARVRPGDADSHLRDNDARERIEYPVLAWDPDGEGPVRILDETYGVAFALYVERSDLAPRIRETALLVTDEPGELARVRLASSAVVDVALEAFDAGEPLVPVQQIYWGMIRFSGELRREDLTLVSRRADLGPLEATHTTHGDMRELRAEPGYDADLVAELSDGTDLAMLAEPNEKGWAEVLAFEEGVVAHGFMRADDCEIAEAYGVGGLGLVGLGRGSEWLELPADTPLFDAPEGERSGRVLTKLSLKIVEARGEWTAVAVTSDWGDLTLWANLPVPVP